MRDNLVPDLRTDKNGVTSTRWVKPGTSSGTKKNNMPVPGIKREGLESKRSRLFDSFDLDRMTGNTVYESKFKGQLDMMSEKSVDEALAVLERNQHSNRVNHAVRHSINTLATNPEKREEELILSIRIAEVESFYEKHLTPSPLGNPMRAIEVEDGAVSSLVVRDDLDKEETQKPLELTEERANEIYLAAHVASAIEMHKTNVSHERRNFSDYWSVFQDHGDLVGVFSEFSDRLDEAMEYVYENGADAGALRQYLRGDHMALAGGAL